MTLPFTQRDLADALGLSLVHTNKTLAKLRDQQLASWSDQVLQVNDRRQASPTSPRQSAANRPSAP
jgi:CRP-like cAMP-binding protein